MEISLAFLKRIPFLGILTMTESYRHQNVPQGIFYKRGNTGTIKVQEVVAHEFTGWLRPFKQLTMSL